MKPTILFVYPNEFNPQLGGIERVTDLLTKELIERGYDVKYLNVVKSGIEYKFPAPVFYFPSQMVKDPINTVFRHKNRISFNLSCTKGSCCIC